MTRGLPPIRKNLGQHFLTDRRILERIADALELTGERDGLEIGPGRGSLTEVLVPRAKRLVLIEYDRALAAILRERYAGNPAVEVVEADVLTRRPRRARAAVRSGSSATCRTTSRRRFSFTRSSAPRPDRAVYLVQREVAERIVAEPGTKDYGALSVNVQAVADREAALPRRARVVSAAAQGRERGGSHRTARRSRRRRGRRRRASDASFRTRSACAASRCGACCGRSGACPADAAEAALAACRLDPSARPETLSPQNFADLLRARGRERLVAVRQREAEPLELHRHVHRLHGDVGGRLELRRRKVQNRLHARLHDAIEDGLRLFAGHGEHDDVRMLALRCRARAARCRGPECLRASVRSCPGCCRRRRGC